MIPQKEVPSQKIIPEPAIHLQLTLNCKAHGSRLAFVGDTSYIATIWENNSSMLKHVGFDGNVISKLACPIGDLRELIVVSEEEVIILMKNSETRWLIIVVWNLVSNNFYKVAAKLLSGEYEVSMIYFKDSNMVCVCSKFYYGKI